MRWPHRTRARVNSDPGVSAVVRVDRRTKNLTKRLRPGEIAVIDHEDLDRVSAEALVACRARAVVNAAPSISGRYPNLGPQILLQAGIPLIDDAGADLLEFVVEGEVLRLEGGTLYRGTDAVGQGVVRTAEDVAEAMEKAREGLSDQLRAFAANTMEYLEREHSLLLDGVGIPDLTTDLDGRHALIVVRGHHYREDIATLRPYIQEYRPVMIGVDGGADALLEAGYTPQLIVGDMDSVSDRALCCGAELVVHAYRDGRAPGLERLQALGLDAVVFPATGTSEDVAMLLADDCGASLIVAVGTHATLDEFLDKGRAGMASTFLTRLRVGGKLVDAKGVSRLYRSRVSNWQLAFLLLACLVTMAVAFTASPSGRAIGTTLSDQWGDFTYWLSNKV
ncbi:putative cytokinetic ring protein SteA [Sporichthya brevicatena]|uniref:Cytokinetic ring protein SteA n=1 Tax=Sporichthya brevicatena TaxID=171442 RepID=A0ABN1H1S7_9ACTN